MNCCLTTWRAIAHAAADTIIINISWSDVTDSKWNSTWNYVRSNAHFGQTNGVCVTRWIIATERSEPYATHQNVSKRKIITFWEFGVEAEREREDIDWPCSCFQYQRLRLRFSVSLSLRISCRTSQFRFRFIQNNNNNSNVDHEIVCLDENLVVSRRSPKTLIDFVVTNLNHETFYRCILFNLFRIFSFFIKIKKQKILIQQFSNRNYNNNHYPSIQQSARRFHLELMRARARATSKRKVFGVNKSKRLNNITMA